MCQMTVEQVFECARSSHIGGASSCLLRPLALRRHQGVPTKGLNDTARFALGAVLVYQLALLRRHEWNLDTNRRLKAFLRAA